MRKTKPICAAEPGGTSPRRHGTRGKCAKQTQFLGKSGGDAQPTKRRLCETKPNLRRLGYLGKGWPSHVGILGREVKRAKRTQFAPGGGVCGVKCAKQTQFAAGGRERPSSRPKASAMPPVTRAIVPNKTRATKVWFNRTDPRYRPGNAGRNPTRRLLSWASNKANFAGAPGNGRGLVPFAVNRAKQSQSAPRGGRTNKANLPPEHVGREPVPSLPKERPTLDQVEDRLHEESRVIVQNKANSAPRPGRLCGCRRRGRTYNAGNGSESRSSGRAMEKGSYRI
jgi:hypothetical protein